MSSSPIQHALGCPVPIAVTACPHDARFASVVILCNDAGCALQDWRWITDVPADQCPLHCLL